MPVTHTRPRTQPPLAESLMTLPLGCSPTAGAINCLPLPTTSPTPVPPKY